jgi:ribosomal subunit interface protein
MYPVTITIRDTPKSTFLDDFINKKAEKLTQLNQRITSCKVVIDMPQKHKHQGKLFRASIALNVRGKELVVNRKLDEDVYIAVTYAFDAIERKLEDYGHRRVTATRRRKRPVNGNGFAIEEVVNGEVKKPTNDEFFTDELEHDFEEVHQIMRDENLL